MPQFDIVEHSDDGDDYAVDADNYNHRNPNPIKSRDYLFDFTWCRFSALSICKHQDPLRRWLLCIRRRVRGYALTSVDTIVFSSHSSEDESGRFI